jgi:hypothetical protein
LIHELFERGVATGDRGIGAIRNREQAGVGTFECWRPEHESNVRPAP